TQQSSPRTQSPAPRRNLVQMNLPAPLCPRPTPPAAPDSARHADLRLSAPRPRASRFSRAVPRSAHASRELPPQPRAPAATVPAILHPSRFARNRATEIIHRFQIDQDPRRRRVWRRGIARPPRRFQPSGPRSAPARARKTPPLAPPASSRESQAHATRPAPHKPPREESSSNLIGYFL